jgi:hypothetical protein
MIRKSVKRFSEKIMPNQKPKRDGEPSRFEVDRRWIGAWKTGPRDETVAARSLLTEAIALP